MEFKKIDYLIQLRNPIGMQHVTGYASSFPDVRICARQKYPKHWIADHYDTGAAFPGVFGSRQECIDSAISQYKYQNMRGAWDAVLAEVQKSVDQLVAMK